MSNGNAPNPNQQLTNLHWRIQTGDDDVRSGSNVFGQVVILQGNQVMTIGKSLNDGNEWSNGSTNDADIGLPPIQLRDVDGVRITFSSGSCFFCTEDNWNMNNVVITYKDDNGQDLILFQDVGNPLHRFTGSDPSWAQPFNWPPG
jgi:hypothetical protein